MDKLSGAELIAAARRRQITREGYSAEHDDTLVQGELARAAMVYADPTSLAFWAPPFWPWEEGSFRPKSRKADLVRAGTLIAAEIDRLQRAAGGDR